MAHIPDGVLSAPVLITGAAVSAALVAVSLRRLDEARLPQAAVLAAAFFVAALITVPIGPSSLHLLLNGLMGLLLGWLAVPALLVALLLQAALFGYGGLTALGVNAMNLMLPALLCAGLLRPWLLRGLPDAGDGGGGDGRVAAAIGAAAGALGVLGTGALTAATLAASGEAFLPAARLVLLTFAPLALAEALITAVILGFLVRVEPALLALPAPAGCASDGG